MPEVEIQEPVCGKCGVEVRQDTAFCYNCGAPVTSAPDLAAANGARPVADEKLIPNRETRGAKSEIPAASGETEADPRNGSTARLEDRRPPSPKYESAAGLRRRSRPPARKPVEVTWEPETDSLNIKFIIAAVCCLVLAIVLVVLALYLK